MYRTRSAFDVLIVGSGPAGASAAFALARQGVAVAMIEKEIMPRYKACGGGIVRRTLDLAPIDLSPAIEHRCCCVDLNFLSSKRTLRLDRNEPVISMTMRSNLDALLAEAAMNAGAQLFDDHQALNLTQLADGIELRTNRRTFRGKYVIAADGASGCLARKAGWTQGLQLFPALEFEIRAEEHVLDKFRRSARFDFDLLSAGYGWVFPKKSHLSIGILSMQSRAARLRPIMSDYVRMLNMSNFEILEQRSFSIPLQPRADGFMRRRTLLVGDAAALALIFIGDETYAHLTTNPLNYLKLFKRD